MSCRSIPPRLGTDPSAATTTVDGVFGGIAARFNRPARDPKVRTSRRLISRSALTPSRVFSDTAAWNSSPSSNIRSFTYRGVIDGNGYRLTTDSATLRPVRAGEGRHDTRLRRLSNSEFEW